MSVLDRIENQTGTEFASEEHHVGVGWLAGHHVDAGESWYV